MKKGLYWLCLLAVPFLVYADEPVIIADFDKDPGTNLGSEIIAHRKIPSDAKWELDGEVFRGESGKSLRIEYIRLAGGSDCYVLLKIPGVKVTEDQVLSFWIKGKEGGEIFDVGLRDHKMAEGGRLPEPMVYVDRVLEGGVTEGWQRVVIPVTKFRSRDLDLQSLESVVIAFNRITKFSVIYLDDVRFEASPQPGGNK